MRSSPSRLAVWWLLALVAIAASAASAQLVEAWRPLEGKTGFLEKDECGYRFTPGGPTQRGNATVISVAADYVVIVERRDQEAWEHTIPLSRITIRKRK